MRLLRFRAAPAPKEKAFEIYFAMLNEGKGLTTDFLAKQCALIAVNEILNISYFINNHTEEDELYKNFWLQVQQKIKIL